MFVLLINIPMREKRILSSIFYLVQTSAGAFLFSKVLTLVAEADRHECIVNVSSVVN